jgi:uncharacterized protein
MSSIPMFNIKKSSIGGLGLFARTKIPKDHKIVQYIGKKVTTVEADSKPNRYIFEIDNDWSIDGSPRYNVARYVNHSCDPNAESVMEEDGKENKIFFTAIKDIEPGEEVTIDYGEVYFNDYIKNIGCKCNTSKCKKIQYVG